MSNTLQTSLNWAACFVGQINLTGGTGSEPAMTCANMILDTILGPPFKWSFNRANSTLSLTLAGGQDYSATLTDFGFLERATVATASKTFEIKDVYNNIARPVAVDVARPNAIYVQSSVAGTSQVFSFLSAPDQSYTATVIYQKLPVHMTALNSVWSGIPDQYSNIYNSLFLSEMFALAFQEQRAAYYRQRGVMSLLALAEGLTDADKSQFLEQYLMRDAQSLRRQMRTQQGVQALGV